jgi:lipopolysaccharide/colanic/teichoic acid biosynthesis glycosyltransferase
MGFYARHGKRFFDLTVSTIALFVFALPMALIALKIRNELGKPVLFRQPRVGKNSRLFSVLKFRTMAGDDGVVASGFCRQLRACAFDELPQLVNIFRGEMSCVGPRPLIPEELKTLGEFPDGEIRFSVRPGLAGIAQLYGDKNPSLRQRLDWDLSYIRNCSLGLDLWILLRSTGITLQGAWEKSGAKI